MNHLPILFGYHATGLGNSHVPLSLCTYWARENLPVRLYVPSAEPHLDLPWLIKAMGPLQKKLVYRFAQEATPGRITEKHFLACEKNTPVVYLWAGLSLEIFQQCAKAGAQIIIERINCHQATARRIVHEAGTRYGIDPGEAYTPEAISQEKDKLDLCHRIFCPSPMVSASMIENGVDGKKLLATSYGWAPERFPRRNESKETNKRPVFLFAGTLCLRKGLPLLLDAWKKADLDAELLLCGGIDPEFKEYMTPYLSHKTLRHIPYTTDIGELFRRADVFVFPTLEEGGPMVTYEAMAHGVPPLVTSMGAGAIVEDGINGTVLPDNDAEAWAAAMTEMVTNPDRREQIGHKARSRAQSFTWEKVAAQRAHLLDRAFPDLWQKTSTTPDRKQP